MAVRQEVDTALDAAPDTGADSGARVANEAGLATAMTLLIRQQIWGSPYLRVLLWAIRHLHPLTKARALSFIHFAHFSVLDGLGEESARGGARKSTYLLFESNFNGLWQEYIEAFCQVIDTDINALLASSEGFPGLLPARGFQEFMENHEFVAEHYYSAYPDASATIIRAALELDQKLSGINRLAERQDDARFLEGWRRFLADRQVQANLAGQACEQPGVLAYLRQLFFGKKNVAGNAYAFISLTPVAANRVDEMRGHIRDLSRGESPMAAVPGTHFARWVVLDRVFHDSWPERFELLDPAYLLFTVVFDRTPSDAVGDFLDRMLSITADTTDSIWSCCAGWPTDGAPRERVEYLRRHRRDADFLVAGYPGSVGEIRRVLGNRALLVDFAQQAQSLAPNELRDTFAARPFTFAGNSGDKNLGAQR